MGMLSPFKRELAMNLTTTQWEQENLERPLERGRYNYVILEGSRAPGILNSSDDPDEQAAQGQGQFQHGLQHRELGLTPARKLNTTKSLTNLSRTSAHTRRTGLSLASMSSGLSYSSRTFQQTYKNHICYPTPRRRKN